MTVIDMLLGDGPRARATDPIYSHLAADRSESTRARVKDAVLVLVRQEGSLTGSELNELYRTRRDRYGWPKVAWDSPRKRAGELHRDRLLHVLNEGHPRGTESEYTLLGVTG